MEPRPVHFKARTARLNGDEFRLRPAITGDDHFIATRGGLEQARELILGGSHVYRPGGFLEGGGVTQDRFFGFIGRVFERLPFHGLNVAS